MTRISPAGPADAALSLLFKKLHPLLEDAAHAQERGAPARDLERLHLKLLSARLKVVEVLGAEVEGLAEEDDLRDALETLASNLTPVGESFRQSLILTQLCLEEAPEELLPHLPCDILETAPWAARLQAFQGRLADPAFHAERRWEGVDEDIGETEEG